MARISRDALVSRSEQPLTNELGANELVMLDIERGRYFGLRDVGKDVWDALGSPTTVHRLCQDLTQAFDVDEATCERDVIDFLDQLLDQGLIEVHDAAPTP